MYVCTHTHGLHEQSLNHIHLRAHLHTGADGSDGLNGEKGMKGEQGIQGKKGETGLHGPPGPQGMSETNHCMLSQIAFNWLCK